MPRATTARIVEAEERQQLLRHQQEESADEGSDAHPDPRSDPDALNRTLRVAGAEILPGNRGRRSHQADRGPGDERKEPA